MLTKDKIKVGTLLYCVIDRSQSKTFFDGEVMRVGRKWADVRNAKSKWWKNRLDMTTVRNGAMYGEGFLAYETEQDYLDHEMRASLWRSIGNAVYHSRLPDNISIADMLDFAETIGVELPRSNQ